MYIQCMPTILFIAFYIVKFAHYAQFVIYLYKFDGLFYLNWSGGYSNQYVNFNSFVSCHYLEIIFTAVQSCHESDKF